MGRRHPPAPRRGRLIAGAVALAVALGAAAPLAARQPAAADADRATALAVARAAVDRRDWPAALRGYGALEARAPADVDLLIESARVHGFADRNADAAARYRRVLELAPARRGDVLLALAWQTLWAGDAMQAHALFVEVAQRPSAFAGGGDGFDAWRGAAEALRDGGRLADALDAFAEAMRRRPDDAGVARKRAETLAWLDRYDEAIAAYTEILARDPDDRGSAYGRAQARNFAGRHREAVADYRAAFARDRTAGRTPPEHARFDHARALRWGGYDDFAHAELGGLAAGDARWLRDFRTGRELRHRADAGVEFATDSDSLDARVASGALGWRLLPTASLDLGLRSVRLVEPTRSVDGERVGLTWRHRFAADVDAIGTPADRGPAWASATLQANRYGEWRPTTGVARAHWLPVDAVRIDAEAGREVVETPLAIANRVTAGVAALGAAWRGPVHSLAASATTVDYSDDNRRTRLKVRADRVLAARPRVIAGVEAMAFRSSAPTSDTHPAAGYWNPRRYSEARAVLGIAHDARTWDVALKLGLGISREVDGWGNASRGTPNSVDVAAGVDLDRSLRLQLQAGGSGGSFGVASGGEGYWRRHAGISLAGWF